MTVRLRLGTRGSALARWQAQWVASRLGQLGVEVEMVHVTTTGDRSQSPIGAAAGSGLFTKEIQRELLDGRIDLAVHSLKDLPTDILPGLVLAAVPERGPIADVLVSARYGSFDQLPAGAVSGTGSLRRRAQLLDARPDLVMRDIRGNVDTRLRKLHEGDFDAIILAEAGLRRLELAHEITEVLPLSLVLPAVGQGALGIETRDSDATILQALTPLDHEATHAAVLAERAMLRSLAGGCLAPIAAWGRIEGDQLALTARVLSADGRQKIEVALQSPVDLPGGYEAAEKLGQQAADALLAQGAAALIDEARGAAR